MQGEEALRTVEECLRGRLLAERAASKTANNTVDILTTKLKELEEKVENEEKCRRKAEKKLNNLKKKLENLKFGFSYNNNWEESDECSIISLSESSNSIMSSSKSSSSTASNSSSGFRDLNLRSASSSSNAGDQGERIGSDVNMEKDQQAQSLSGLKPSSASEKEREREEKQREDDEHHVEVDDSMALVPLSLPIESKDNSSNKEVIKISNERVREVLDTLKQIRENIQSTMERRRLIQVG